MIKSKLKIALLASFITYSSNIFATQNYQAIEIGAHKLYRYDFNIKNSEFSLTRALDDGKLALEDVYSCVTRHGAKAGFNGGFFYEGHGKNGIPRLAFLNKYNIFAINSDQDSIYKTKDNKIKFGKIKIELFLTSEEKNKVKIDSINNPVETGTKIFTTNYWMSTLTNPGTTEIIVRRGFIHDINQNGNNRIPLTGFIISTTEDGAKELAKFENDHKMHHEILITSDSEKIDQNEIEWLISGSDFLIKDSKIPEKISSKKDESSFRDEPHGRTAICQLSEENFAVIVSDHNPALSAYDLSLKEMITPLKSEGLDREKALAMPTGKLLEMFNKTQKNKKHSIGMKLPEFAEYLKSIGCINAINMDGGGSSTLVVDNEIVNNPTGLQNKKVAGKNPREVGDIFLIK